MAVDINDPMLLEQQVEINPNVDPSQFFAPPLLDDGEYDAIIGLGDRGITLSQQKDSEGKKTGAGFLNVHLHAKTMDAAGNPGLGAFDNPTSIIMQSQGMGRLQAILLLMGAKLPERFSLRDLKEITETTFAQSPRLKITTRWEAQVKLADGSYQTIRTGQRNFPPVLDEYNKPTGRYQTEVTDPKTGLVGNAQVRIIRYARA